VTVGLRQDEARLGESLLGPEVNKIWPGAAGPKEAEESMRRLVRPRAPKALVQRAAGVSSAGDVHFSISARLRRSCCSESQERRAAGYAGIYHPG
jgi:hypothetical protein